MAGFAVPLLVVLVFCVASTARAQTAVFDAAWGLHAPASSPAGRYAPAMAADGSGTIVVFGGESSGSTALGDTWVWNGTSWIQRFPLHNPPARYFASMAFHPATGLVVLFGGTAGTTSYLSDTWTWNGTDWTQMSGTGPPARDSAVLALSPSGDLVLFGGSRGTSGLVNDTWTWNGAAWTLQAAGAGPSARQGASMVYLASVGQTLLFGGEGIGGALGDTWVWSGSNWTQQTAATSPAARYFAGMAYSGVGQATLFGGYNGSVPLGDTWTWTGGTWMQDLPVTSPAARSGPGVAANANGLVVFGGFNATDVPFSDTWALQPGAVSAGTANVCTSGVPTPCSTTATLTFAFTGAGTIKAPAVLTQGLAGLDFTAAGTGTCTSNGIGHFYFAGTTCTLVVKFAPTAPGLRLGVAQLLNGSGAAIATAFVSGIGTAPATAVVPGTITTVAGNGTQGYNGNGIQATSAELSNPGGIAVDSGGNLYIADTNNQQIRKVTASTGLVSSIAGGTANGYAGDGAAATGAKLNLPLGVAVDGAGNVYIADSGNARIRRISLSTGLIATIAGSGSTSYNGDGIAATSAGLNAPQAVAVDSAGNVYIADGNRIRMVAATTGLISTVAGNGTAGYSGDGGLATAAEISGPEALVVDASGNLYFVDEGNLRVRKVIAATGLISTVAGTGGAPYGGDGGPATSAGMQPWGVALDAAGDLYIADGLAGRVRRVGAAGVISTVGGSGATGFSGDAGSATVAGVPSPGAITVDSAGDIFVVDGSGRVRRIAVGGFGLRFANTPVGSTSSDSPQTLTVSNIGNAPLVFATPASGYNPNVLSNFGYGSGSTCTRLSNLTAPVSLAPGASCTEQVNFTPTTTGPLSGAIIDTDNSVGTSHSVPLNGTGTSIFTTLNVILSPYVGVVAGQTVGLTASVTPSTGTGSVVFSDNNSPVSGAVSVANGTAVYSVEGIAAGPHSFSAAFTGTNSYANSVSANYPLWVDSVATVTVASQAVGYGTGSATLSAAVAYGGALPAGQVTFQVDGGAVVAASCSGSGSAETCTASYATGALAVGSHAITVTLAADSNYLATTGSGTLVVQEPSYSASAQVGLSTATMTATIYFPVDTTLHGTASTAIQVVTQGVTGLDFLAGAPGTCTAGASYLAGASCTVNWRFAPLAPGYRPGAIVLVNQAQTVAATVLLNGNAMGPLGAFTPGVISTLAMGLHAPGSVYPDAAGNVYVADDASHVIKKVAAGTGAVTVVAGTGVQSASAMGTNGDGGPATSATLNLPQNVLVDGAGNVYLNDSGNNRVRRVDAVTGLITTVGGNGLGNGTTGAAPDTGDGGLAVNAEMSGPAGLAMDAAGNLYVSDFDSGRIRKIAGGFISTYAGNGTQVHSGDNGPATSAGIAGPANLSFDAAGNLYVAEFLGNSIRKITPGGTITSVVGNGTNSSTGDGGPAGSATVSRPNDVAVDAAGNLYIAEGQRIRQVLATTGAISTIAGNGTAGYTGDGGAATQAELHFPYGVRLDGAGNLYVAEHANNVVRKVTATAAPLAFATTAVGSTSSDSPKTVILTNEGNTGLAIANAGATANFAVAGGTCPASGTLGAGSACTVGASFVPTHSGSDTGTLNVTDNQLNGLGSVESVALSGTGTDTPSSANSTLVASPGSLPVASSSTLTLTLKNAAGVAVVGYSYAMTASGSATFANGLQSMTLVTNASGFASTTLTDTVAEQVTVGAGVSAQVTFTPYALLVTTLSDDATGVAGNCTTVVHLNGVLSNTPCSLRDALAGVNALPSGVKASIGFLSALFASATRTSPAVYQLGASHGPLTVTGGAAVTINGPTGTDTGGSFNALAVDGGAVVQVMSLSGSGSAVLNGLIFRNGFTSGAGGAGLVLTGTEAVTLNNSTVSGNQAGGYGGGGVCEPGPGGRVADVEWVDVFGQRGDGGRGYLLG